MRLEEIDIFGDGTRMSEQHLSLRCRHRTATPTIKQLYAEMGLDVRGCLTDAPTERVKACVRQPRSYLSRLLR
jgi:hypothetical protein